MLLLAIDTCCGGCSAALVRLSDGRAKVLAYEVEEELQFQSERLFILIERVMGDLSYQEIQYVGVNVGPGSFTGVRIGLGAAQGMRLGQFLRGKLKSREERSNDVFHIVPVTSTMACGYQEVFFSNSTLRQVVDTVIPAGRERFYVQKFFCSVTETICYFEDNEGYGKEVMRLKAQDEIALLSLEEMGSMVMNLDLFSKSGHVNAVGVALAAVSHITSKDFTIIPAYKIEPIYIKSVWQ